MQKTLKIFAFLFLLSVYPTIRFIAHNFIIESDREIYQFIPQESDVIIELNTRNFINEVAYQRVFNDEYFREQIFSSEDEVISQFPKFGINFFTSIILFREQWADENIWMCLIEYRDKTDLTNFITDEIPGAKLVFGDKFAIVQISSSSNQSEVDDHLTKVINKEVKSIYPKIDLLAKFDKEKEINCYFEPGSINADNQLINGFLSFNFLADEIKIDGDFIPISGFEDNPSIAYAIDKESAFSMRSSLNIFNSIFWFSKERIDNVPEYSQMALDYDGVHMFVVDPNFNNNYPFKAFPEFQMHFDLYDPVTWKEFFDNITEQGKINVDTITNQLITKEGAYFQYSLTDNEFELMRSEVNLTPAEEEGVHFQIHMNIDDLINNTKLSIDEENPPNFIMRTASEAVFDVILEEIHVLANIETVNFKMTEEDESKIIADGLITMKNKEGNSIIESLAFGKELLIFIKDYLDSPEEE